jgi:hypothetical protein
MLRVLTSAKIGFDAHLIYGVSRIFFDAHFWPPNPNVPYERLYIRIGAVPAKQAREIREFVQAAVITTWVQNIISLPANSPIRRKKQCFRYDLPPRMVGN